MRALSHTALPVVRPASSLMVAPHGPAQAQPRRRPRDLHRQAAGLGAKGGAGAADDPDRHPALHGRTAIANRRRDGLKSGGYPAFLTALRKAPEVGRRHRGDRSGRSAGRESSQDAQGTARIVLVTDQPMFFVGGGRDGRQAARRLRGARDPDGGRRRRPRQGLDGGGREGQARGEAGVEIDDYADKPIELVTVVRKL